MKPEIIWPVIRPTFCHRINTWHSKRDEDGKLTDKTDNYENSYHSVDVVYTVYIRETVWTSGNEIVWTNDELNVMIRDLVRIYLFQM